MSQPEVLIQPLNVQLTDKITTSDHCLAVLNTVQRCPSTKPKIFLYNDIGESDVLQPTARILLKPNRT